MSKKINISLLGKELTLNFAVSYFYKYFKEATGIDLFAVSFDISQKVLARQREIEIAEKNGTAIPEENGMNITENSLYKMIASSDYFIYAAGIVYAGYAAERSVNQLPIEHKFEFIQHCIYSLDGDEVAGIINKYNSIRVEGELESQPNN
jgi:hypothetical protein